MWNKKSENNPNDNQDKEKNNIVIESKDRTVEEGEEVKHKNINFFKKVWYSITKFEKYIEMAMEGVGRSLKYLLQLVLIFVLIIACIGIYDTNKNLNIFVKTIEEKVPDFKYADGNVELEESNKGKSYILEGKNLGIGKIVIDLETEDESIVAEYEKSIMENNENDKRGVIILKDKIIQISKISENAEGEKEVSMTYDEMLQNIFGTSNIELTKRDIIDYLNGDGRTYIYIVNFFSYFIGYFIIYICSGLIYVLLLAGIGYFTGIFTKLKLRFSIIYSMSVYAFTLSNILNMIYFILNYFAGITIKYFDIAYLAIAYVYLITVIFLIKSDFFKKQQDVLKKDEKIEKGKENGQEQI